ncbi:MAG: hypothetical protein AAF739_16440 [Pseudomonadota bacterium]
MTQTHAHAPTIARPHRWGLAALGGLLIALASLILPSGARAECTRAERPTTISDSEINLRVYDCNTFTRNVRVEFHRLSSNTVANLQEEKTTAELGALLGTPRIVEGEIWFEFRGLRNQFGSRRFVPPAVTRVVASGSGDVATGFDEDAAGSLHLLGIGSGFYPAIDELRFLEGGRDAPGLQERNGMLWRFMTREDVRQYVPRLRSLNETLFGGRLEREGQTPVDDALMLLDHLTRAHPMPPDFMVMAGEFITAACAFEPGWRFSYFGRVILMDVMVIENLSERPIDVGSFVGTRTRGGLRLPSPAGDEFLFLRGFEEPLEPGARVMVPLALSFAPSDAMRAFTNSTYVYGTELSIAGMFVNDVELTFEERNANFIEMSSVLEEAGSCPYLQAFDGEVGGWVEHGKVLHAANSADRSDTETLQFPGLRTQFRLEEREPEVAFIDAAVLTLDLHDGTSVTLQTDHPDLAAIDDKPAIFRWGEAVAFDFAVPEDIDPETVVRSTLDVTGYYLTYTSLAGMSDPPMPVRGSLLSNASQAPVAQMCPIDITMPARLLRPDLTLN